MYTPPRHTQKTRLTHDALCVTQELLQQTRQFFLANQNNLQAINERLPSSVLTSRW